MKYKCTRCASEIVFEDRRIDNFAGLEATRWKHYLPKNEGGIPYVLCPRCYHELKRFLAGEEIKKLVS